jgi:hypothetical protein
MGSSCCARCGEPRPLHQWRTHLRLCMACWPVVEEWASNHEWSVRVTVERNDEAMGRKKRGTGYYR